MTESKIQSDFHKHVWNNYPLTRYLCFHIPNEAKRTGYAYMTAMGMVGGIPDYICNFPSGAYRSLYLEFKSADGKLSENQKKAQAALRFNSIRVEVVRTFEEALEIFKAYIIGTEYEK